jgi:hypothetical protein
MDTFILKDILGCAIKDRDDFHLPCGVTQKRLNGSIEVFIFETGDDDA